MQIQDIVTKIYGLTKTNNASYPAALMLIDLNIAYSRITSLIFQSDGRWEWDDSNNSDLPVATTSLVANQQDYSLSVGQLFIERVEVLPNGGTYFYKLFPRDVQDPMWGSDILGIDTVSKAAPMLYDVNGTSVFLYPIPNYSQAASLKIYFKRAQVDFSSGDLSTGTLVPGFASIFHDLLAYLVAFDYCTANGLDSAPGYWAVIQRKEAALQEHYTQRNLDDSPRLSMRRTNFK